MVSLGQWDVMYLVTGVPVKDSVCICNCNMGAKARFCGCPGLLNSSHRPGWEVKLVSPLIHEEPKA